MESKMRVVISDLDCYVMARSKKKSMSRKAGAKTDKSPEGRKNSKPVSFGPWWMVEYFQYEI
jgi:hypothetical protein